MMRMILLLIVCAGLGVVHAAESSTSAPPAATSTNRCAEFELKDQLDHLHAIKFPSAKPILLTVADKKGSDGIAAWAQPLGVRFGDRIQISGLADVSAVPRPLRGFVQGKFKKAFVYPVMLDWEGKACAGFKYEKGRPNLYFISRDGRILAHRTNSASETAVQEFSDLIEAELKSGR